MGTVEKRDVQDNCDDAAAFALRGIFLGPSHPRVRSSVEQARGVKSSLGGGEWPSSVGGSLHGEQWPLLGSDGLLSWGDFVEDGVVPTRPSIHPSSIVPSTIKTDPQCGARLRSPLDCFSRLGRFSTQDPNADDLDSLNLNQFRPNQSAKEHAQHALADSVSLASNSLSTAPHTALAAALATPSSQSLLRRGLGVRLSTSPLALPLAPLADHSQTPVMRAGKGTAPDPANT